MKSQLEKLMFRRNYARSRVIPRCMHDAFVMQPRCGRRAWPAGAILATRIPSFNAVQMDKISSANFPPSAPS